MSEEQKKDYTGPIIIDGSDMIVDMDLSFMDKGFIDKTDQEVIVTINYDGTIQIKIEKDAE